LRGDVERLARRVGHAFARADLLEAALTHRSAQSQHNERLEFLGDAVLGLVSAEALWRRFPQATEGQLTRLRAQLVKRETLAAVARELDLGSYLRLGPGELRSGGHARDSILADALEAVLGAVYLDGGLEAARAVMLQLLGERLAAMTSESQPKDAKTRLQELLQARRLALPAYAVLETRGDDHAQTFMVRCEVGALGLSVTAEGPSRRRAEQAAAAAMLQEMGEEHSG
jgi:ribonuclease-3